MHPRQAALLAKVAKFESETRETTLESVYFHTGNGGLTIGIEESHSRSGLAGEEPRDSFDHTLTADYSHMGTGISTEIPLGSMEIVGWIHEATGRLLKRMATQPDQARNGAYTYEETGQTKGYNFRWDVEQGRTVPVDETTRDKSWKGFAEMMSRQALIRKAADLIERIEGKPSV